MLWVQEYPKGLHTGNDVLMWVKFVDWGRISIGGIVVDVYLRFYVLIKPLFSGKIWVEVYGLPH